MTLEQELFDRLAREVIEMQDEAHARELMGVVADSAPVKALFRLRTRQPSAQFLIAFTVGFLTGRRYEVADTLAQVAVDSGEKAT